MIVLAQRLAQDCGREFREAGMYGLYAALGRRRELDACAQRLELSRRSHKHLNKHRTRPRHAR